MTTSAERTIGLGHQIETVRVAKQMGFGERREKNRRLPGFMQGESGWFVSPSELELIEAEQARRAAVKREDRLERRRAQRKRDKAARPKPRSPRKRAVETWRLECADPLSERTPEQAWAYAWCSALNLDPEDKGTVIPPMPSETPQARLPRSVALVEIASSHDGSEHGREETRVERNARLQRESRQRKRKPSAATAGIGWRR